jgi:thermostable 8-oxoguanine DNA glycosylase
MQTYTDAIETMLSQSVVLPSEVLNVTQNFIDANKQLGYNTREEFIRDAIRFRIRFLRNQTEYIEISKDEYNRLEQALRDLDTPFQSVEDFMRRQVEGLLEKHTAWLKQKETFEER